MTNNRDDIRSSILSSKQSKGNRKLFDLLGTEIEIRQPTLAQLNEQDDDDKVPGIVRMLIKYSYVPGTDDKVFEDTDIEVLSNLPAGEWINSFNSIFEELTGIKIEDKEKN